MLDELKAHLEEMLRGFRSGVAIAEDHLVEALAKLERAAAQLLAPAPVVAQIAETVAENPVPVDETAKAVAETAGADASTTDTAEVAEPQAAAVFTDPQPAAAN